ncbi:MULTISPECIES: hypothetical protein [unclassified Flavobacterium]|jgi:hypothetical protein|uniref:hypothetical protein n=1 Tax=unclassified Flavobacterium TaxID=196869 RepID=UPI0025C698F0|nr:MULTISPECIES: hypothetical protein [unclassified Flavobacterium]
MKKITTFWNYFQKNEQEIINAFFLGINTEEIYSQFINKLNYISKRIGFEITKPSNNQDKCTIIFTGYGYRKLFPKIIALEEQAPPLEYFTAQAFIKPLEDITKYKNGTDSPCICENYEIKISEIQMALMDYNINTKQIKINIYLPYYNEIKQYKDLKSNLDWIVMQIVGEIAFRKHIKHIQLNQLPQSTNGLLSLVELPDLIDYLYKINSRKKTILI